MSGVIVLPGIRTASGGRDIVVDALTSAGSALRKVVVGVGVTNSSQSASQVSAVDLEQEFAFWANESLELARQTFDAQAEAWPAD
jgi:hypothetical protein